MLGGGRDQCLTIGDESFSTTRCEDLGSLDNIDRGSSCEEVRHTQGCRKKGQETSGEDSGEGSLSQSGSERNSTGYVSSAPLSDTTDTGDTVIFCGESGISGMSIGGGRSVSNEGPLPSGNCGEKGGNQRNVSPSSVSQQSYNIPQSRVTSLECEDTYHDGGTHASGIQASAARTPSTSLSHMSSSSTHKDAPCTVSGILLPQLQHATSEFSQANLVTDSHSSGRTVDPPTPVICNGSPHYAGCEPQPQHSRRRHPAESSNGVLPHSRMANLYNSNNAVSRSAQGNPSSLVGNHLTHLSREITSPYHGENTSSFIANSVDTSCARVPQDAGLPANSLSRDPLSQKHYRV